MERVGRKPLLTVDELKEAIRTYATDSPSVLAEKLSTSPVTICKYKNLIGEEEIQKILSECAEEDLKPSEMQFDVFCNLPAIQEYQTNLQRRKLSPEFYRTLLRGIFRICVMTKKRPEKLTPEHVIKLCDQLNAEGKPVNTVILSARSWFATKGISQIFMTSKGLSVTQVLGKFAGVKLTREQRHAFVERLAYYTNNDPKWIALPYAYFYLGNRADAILNLKIEDINPQFTELKVFDKAKRKLYPNGKPWNKMIPIELAEKLKSAIGDRKQGKVFEGIDYELARATFRKVYADLGIKVAQPIHIWRHTSAQEFLLATGWNLALACKVLGWDDEKTLRKNYGEMPREVLERALKKAMGIPVPKTKAYIFQF